MIITTPEELRLYITTHVIENMNALAGFMDSSEHDFLLSKIGKPLYERMMQEYESMGNPNILLPENKKEHTLWHEFILLCQRPVAFDMMYRAADVSALSINESGINIVSTDNYDAAGKDAVERYKTRCNIEAHRGIDRLLVQLEEWAQTLEPMEETISGGTEEEGPTEKEIQQEIVTLWRKSRYYYLADGLFINTATKFNEFIDIYDSREKFIQLLPDLRYCQEVILRPELGDDLTDQLIEAYQSGKLTGIQQNAVVLIQRALATHVEARNKMFTRKEAKDNAIFLVKLMIDFLMKHQDEMPEGIKTSPFYRPPAKKASPEIGNGATDNTSFLPSYGEEEPKSAGPWKNNRRGNKLFVARPIE